MEIEKGKIKSIEDIDELDEALKLASLKKNGTRFGPWEQTMDLKFIDGALYQKWNRVRINDEGDRLIKQSQWRPVRGQSGVTAMVPG